MAGVRVRACVGGRARGRPRDRLAFLAGDWGAGAVVAPRAKSKLSVLSVDVVVGRKPIGASSDGCGRRR